MCYRRYERNTTGSIGSIIAIMIRTALICDFFIVERGDELSDKGVYPEIRLCLCADALRGDTVLISHTSRAENVVIGS